MNLYIFTLLSLFGINLLGQAPTDRIENESYTSKEVKFESAGITLSGTMLLPTHPSAAIVLVHGSGQEKRMLSMATYLAGKGIAVLTYDKRGVEESGGIYAGPEVGTNNIDSANLNTLASDAAAGCQFLSSHLKNKQVPAGMMGFSQAGWIIPLAALKTPNLKFMVLFSCPVVNTLEQLRFQFYTNGNTNFWKNHSEADALEHTLKDADRYVFAPTDPVKTLSELKIRALWIFGGKDIQIPVGLSTSNLKMLQLKGMRYEYLIFPELGHNTAISKSSDPRNEALQWIQKNFK